MNCGDVKRKRIEQSEKRAKTPGTAKFFEFYLIFSSGSSVFIPK
jgi:hypothetical protein